MEVILRYKDFLSTYKTRGYRIKHLEGYKFLFPLKSTKRLAGIVADLMGDGNLQANPKWRIDFTSKSIKELRRFESEMFLAFKIKGKIRKCSSNKYGVTHNIAFNCSPIARILWLIGVPEGQKVMKSFSVPKWIKSDKVFFARFIQRLFTCEGGIMYEKNRKLPQIRFDMWKAQFLLEEHKKFMDGISKYLNQYFAIKSKVSIINNFSYRKDGIVTQPVRLYIFGDSVINFSRSVCFEGEKQDKLMGLLNFPLETFKSH